MSLYKAKNFFIKYYFIGKKNEVKKDCLLLVFYIYNVQNRTICFLKKKNLLLGEILKIVPNSGICVAFQLSGFL